MTGTGPKNAILCPLTLDEQPGGRTCVFAVFEDANAVDEDVADADRELVGIVECRVVDDGVGIKDDDVGPAAGLELPAVPQ